MRGVGKTTTEKYGKEVRKRAGETPDKDEESPNMVKRLPLSVGGSRGGRGD